MVAILKTHDYKVKISLQVYNNNLLISVSNNYKIHPKEIELLDERIQLARQIKNVKQLFKKDISTHEGSGYGIIVIFLILKKYGLEKLGFKLNVKDDQTKITIALPLARIFEKEQHFISKRISVEIDKIPVIPQHIKKLIR